MGRVSGSTPRPIAFDWPIIFDPPLTVHSSLAEPLPHQITAFYGELLTRQPLRFLLADDPGAGKTIMAGLLMEELLVRGDVQRCLIVSPGSLVEQWQDELDRRFHLPFEILTNDKLESAPHRQLRPGFHGAGRRAASRATTDISIPSYRLSGWMRPSTCFRITVRAARPSFLPRSPRSARRAAPKSGSSRVSSPTSPNTASIVAVALAVGSS